jgi:hypothetical protein
MVVPDFFILILFLMMGTPFVNPFLRSLRLQSDMVAARQFGKERMLQILEKTNGLELRGKEIGGRLARRSGLEERTDTLKQL